MRFLQLSNVDIREVTAPHTADNRCLQLARSFFVFCLEPFSACVILESRVGSVSCAQEARAGCRFQAPHCTRQPRAARAESWCRRSGQRQPGVRPIWQPTLPGPLAGDGQHGCSALQQGCRLLPEAATCFESENDEAAAARTRRARKLRVGVSTLAPCCIVVRPTRLDIGPGIWSPSAEDWAEDGGTDDGLGAMPQREAVGDDCDLSPVCERHIDVHVADSHGLGNAGSGLSAYPRDGRLQWPRIRGE